MNSCTSVEFPGVNSQGTATDNGCSTHEINCHSRVSDLWRGEVAATTVECTTTGHVPVQQCAHQHEATSPASAGDITTAVYPRRRIMHRNSHSVAVRAANTMQCRAPAHLPQHGQGLSCSRAGHPPTVPTSCARSISEYRPPQCIMHMSTFLQYVQ